MPANGRQDLIWRLKVKWLSIMQVEQDAVLIQLTSWWWAPVCSKHV